jgi:hypothetical protein
MFAQLQAKHYGHARMDARRLKELVAVVARRSSKEEPCPLPITGQLPLWQSDVSDAGPIEGMPNDTDGRERKWFDPAIS